jgi:hypothetical protein
LIELANSGKPARAILRNKRIIREIRVFAANPVDLVTLPGTEPFIGVQAPNAFQQSLATKDLVTARNTAAKSIGDIEKGRVAVRDPRIEREQILWQRSASQRSLNAFQNRYGAFGPHRPVTEQPAAEPDHHLLSIPRHCERQGEVEKDVIVISR